MTGFVPPDERTGGGAVFAPPRVIAWELTRRCPLACRHCRAAARPAPSPLELTTAECVRILDSLSPFTFHPSPLIIWTGGEPMARDDLPVLVRHATARGLRSVLAPCGLFATEDRLADLKAAGVTACSFSLDGADAARHDAFRGVPGAYAAVTRAMAAARAVGLPFQVNVTVSRLNLDSLDALHARAVELGATRLDLFFLVPVGRGAALAAHALSPDETRRVLDWAFAKAKAGPIGIKETCCPSAPARWAARGGEASCGPRPCGCLGGRGFAFLSHTGDLQTCGFIDIPCGNIRAFECDFPRLLAAARNPLGRSGTCRA